MAKWSERALSPVAGLGRRALAWWELARGMGALLFAIAARIAPWRLDRVETAEALYRVGVKSFPVIVVTALLTGAIMVIQAGTYIRQYGAYGLLGWGAGYSILREVGPILIGLMFSGRVGANNTAELGTMQVTEQVDALRALAIDPIAYLVLPRFWAMAIMMFALVVVGDLTALLGGAVTSQLLLGVDVELFAWSVVSYVHLGDLFHGLIKAVLFGIAIAVISCHYGMSARGGAVGVGRAVNDSVVGSAIAIFAIDFAITYGTL